MGGGVRAGSSAVGARHLLRVFQVSYQGAVAKEAASQVLDLRGVVCSVSNGEDVAFLHPLKRRKPSSKPELACEACGRFVRKGGSYCSISCKLEVIQRQEILAVMHSPRGTVLKLQAGDGFAGEAASLLPTAAAAMVSSCSATATPRRERVPWRKARKPKRSAVGQDVLPVRRRLRKGQPARAPLF